MKKRLSLLLILAMILTMTACGKTPPKAEDTSGSVTEDTPKKEEDNVTEDKAPSGTVVVYSPHDADPLNAGINMFMAEYPDIKVEVVAAAGYSGIAITEHFHKEYFDSLGEIPWEEGTKRINKGELDDFISPVFLRVCDMRSPEQLDGIEVYNGNHHWVQNPLEIEAIKKYLTLNI